MGITTGMDFFPMFHMTVFYYSFQSNSKQKKCTIWWGVLSYFVVYTVYCKSHIQEKKKKKQGKHAFRIVLVLLLRFSLQPLDIMGGLNAFEMEARWEH